MQFLLAHQPSFLMTSEKGEVRSKKQELGKIRSSSVILVSPF